MKTREVFKILRGQLQPALDELGFEAVKDASGQFLIWSRPIERRKYQTLACQMAKWPWDPWTGSSFRVTLGRSSRRGDVTLSDATKNLFELLDARQRKEVQRIQNEVLAKCRVPTKDEYNQFMGFDGYMDHIAGEYRQSCQKVNYLKLDWLDLWLRITGAEDLKRWANWLAGWLPEGSQR